MSRLRSQRVLKQSWRFQKGYWKRRSIQRWNSCRVAECVESNSYLSPPEMTADKNRDVCNSFPRFSADCRRTAPKWSWRWPNATGNYRTVRYDKGNPVDNDRTDVPVKRPAIEKHSLDNQTSIKLNNCVNQQPRNIQTLSTESCLRISMASFNWVNRFNY